MISVHLCGLLGSLMFTPFKCTTSSSTIEFIKLQRSLRQGDSLAPFFVHYSGKKGCVVYMMSQAIERNLFSSFLVGKLKVEVNLLQYVDDTLFFGKASLANVLTIKSVLRYLELISRLKVNFHKKK